MSKLKTIRTKFIISVLIIALVLTFAIMGFIYFMVGGMLTEEVYGRITANVAHGATRIDNWFIERRAEVDTMYSVFPLLPDEELRFAVLEILFTYISFSNEDAIFGGGWIPIAGWYPTQRPWWINAMENPTETVISPLYVDADSGILTVTISRYLGEIDGYSAVYAKDVFLPDVLEMVWDSIIIEGSYAFMADGDGYIIAHTNDPVLIPKLTVDDLTADYHAFMATNMNEVTTYRQYLVAEIAPGEVFRIRDDGGVNWYMASHEISETGWTLFIAVPQSYVLDGVMRLMFNASVFWFPSIILIVILIGYVVSRVISRPLQKIGMFASNVSTGEIPLTSIYNNAIAVSSNDEIGRLARTLEESYMQLNESRIKSNFLANISHEMKSPLGIMGGYAKLTKKQIEAGTVNEKSLINLQTISDEAMRLADLVNRMLRAAVEMEGVSSFASVVPQDVISNAAAFCEPILTSNKLTFYVEKNCPSVMVNPEMIMEVLVNLIGNANRHTKKGKIELRAESAGTGMVKFSVRDNGEGIPPEMLERAFLRGASGAGSSGIGLSTCKETVENHGGEIKIESAVGEGTVVTFTLPIYNKPEGSGAGISPA